MQKRLDSRGASPCLASYCDRHPAGLWIIARLIHNHQPQGVGADWVGIAVEGFQYTVGYCALMQLADDCPFMLLGIGAGAYFDLVVLEAGVAGSASNGDIALHDLIHTR